MPLSLSDSHLPWQGQVFRRSELACVMRGVAGHEYESGRVRRRSREAAHVAYGVAGGVEEVEGAVAEEVVGFETADFKGLREADLADGVVLVVALQESGVWVGGIAR